jgi:hypothetical protein
MTNQRDETTWPPALFASQLQRASEEMTDQQMRLFEQWLDSTRQAATGNSGVGDLSELGRTSLNTAVFKTRVQSGGRISIPDAEREALGIDEGDLVQAFVIPISRTDGDSNE